MDPFWVQLDDRADGAGQGERGIKMNSDLCSCKGVTWKDDYRLSRWGVETGPCSDRTERGHSSVGSGLREEAECGRLALPEGWEGVRQSLTSHSTGLPSSASIRSVHSS